MFESNSRTVNIGAIIIMVCLVAIFLLAGIVGNTPREIKYPTGTIVRIVGTESRARVLDFSGPMQTDGVFYKIRLLNAPPYKIMYHVNENELEKWKGSE